MACTLNWPILETLGRCLSNRYSERGRLTIGRLGLSEKPSAYTADELGAGFVAILCGGMIVLALHSFSAIAAPQSGNSNTADVAPFDVERSIITEDVALFDESLEWATSKSATMKILQEVQRMGIKVFVPCVWHGRGTYYPSKIASIERRLRDRISAGEDPLEYLIARAHEKGIEVHVWFTVMKREDNQRPEYYDAGTPKGAYDLHSSAFRHFITSLVVEAAQRYDIDGINLDYVRSMGLCSSSVCKETYLAQTGHDLTVDLLRRFVPAVRDRIGTWNRKAIDEILIGIRSGIKARTHVSVDAHPLERITEEQGQFPIRWANKGLVDRIYDMRYDQRLDYDEIAAIRAQLLLPDKLWMLLSNADRVGKNSWSARDPEVIKAQLIALGGRWPSMGVAFWHRPRITAAQSALFKSLWHAH